MTRPEGEYAGPPRVEATATRLGSIEIHGLGAAEVPEAERLAFAEGMARLAEPIERIMQSPHRGELIPLLEQQAVHLGHAVSTKEAELDRD